MANIYPYDINFTFKSENDLNEGLEILSEFFTYDYIGEKRYKIDGLNLQMNVSYLSNEDECCFDLYLEIEKELHLYEILYNVKSLVESVESRLKIMNTKSKDLILLSFVDRIYSIAKRYRKYELMKSILDKCKKYSIGIVEYYEDNDGNEKKRYTYEYSNLTH